MNIIIKRFIITILILVILSTLIVKIFTPQVYEIKYDVYKFVPENQTYIIDKKNESIYIKSFSKNSAIDEAIEFLYLNSLCVSDSIDINSVEVF